MLKIRIIDKYIEWCATKHDIKSKIKFTKFIKIPVNEFLYLNLNNLLLIFLYTKWCKCKLSGFEILVLVFNFLMIENKFSKAGYQSKLSINIGEISKLLFDKFIAKYPKINPKKYAPESPIKTFEKKLKKNKINKVQNNKLILFKSKNIFE